jgi:hypothetical protein
MNSSQKINAYPYFILVENSEASMKYLIPSCLTDSATYFSCDSSSVPDNVGLSITSIKECKMFKSAINDHVSMYYE